VITKFVEQLLIIERNAQREYEKSILSGSFKTLEDYRFNCGILKGIKDAEENILRLYNQMVNNVRVRDVRSTTDDEDE
jgi:hypothetical protein